MRLGIDMDGVVASFDDGFHRLLCEVTGRNLEHPQDPPSWNWPEDVCGCSKGDIAAAWGQIRHDPSFWSALDPLDPHALARLRHLEWEHSLYFITSRVPERAKQETEAWLWSWGFACPTVLLSEEKGPIAKGLHLDVFIDDKVGNLESVMKHSPGTRCYLLARKFNEPSWKDLRWTTVTSLGEMLDLELDA